MSIFDSTQVMLDRAIGGATLRHSVLAGNVANANTPGFQPSDVDFHGALRSAMASGPAAVERLEIGATAGTPVTMRADGSGVDAEAEAAKLAQNGLELEALVQVASARAHIVRVAMGVR
jgi:flagellar basal-body rod protein FlgB